MAEQSNQPGIKDLCKVLSDIEQQHDAEVKRLQEEFSKYEEKLKQKDLCIGRLQEECSKYEEELKQKDLCIGRMQEECSKYKEKQNQMDLCIGRLQQEFQVLKSWSESYIKEEFQRTIDEQDRLKDELEASATQVERLKDVEALARALEKRNIILSEKTRVLENSVEEKKEREKTIKEDAKQKLERTETRWQKKLQGKEDELKRMQTDKKDDALKQIQRELDLKDGALQRLQHAAEKLRKERDDYQVRLSALMSSKLTTNNPEITDLSEINRPTQLAEQWGELYDNEYTELFEALHFDDEKKIFLIFKLLKRSFEICQEIREQGVDWLSYFSENNTMHNPLFKMEEEGDNELRSNEEPADHEDPKSASSKGYKNEGTKDLRSNGEPGNNGGQDSASRLGDKNEGGESQVNPEPKYGIDDTIDDNQKQTMDRCSQTATTEMVKLDVPDELKRELSLYRKKIALEIVDILTKELPERVAKEFDMAWNIGNALDVYLKSCIRLCWLMGIQSPPVYIRFDEHDQASRHAKLDKHFYREYTKAGQYIEYVVWPPLQLHKEGHLLRRGVAQGTNSKD